MSHTCFFDVMMVFMVSRAGFVSEIRDDAGFGRLWGILSRYIFTPRVDKVELLNYCYLIDYCF